jgi:hypothetical protein
VHRLTHDVRRYRMTLAWRSLFFLHLLMNSAPRIDDVTVVVANFTQM